MIDKISVTEQDTDIINKWYDDADHVTRDTLNSFISNIMDSYEFDYGSYCHAVSVCMLATANAVGTELSMFQAECTMFDFMKAWLFPNNKCGLRIVDYDTMLYPHYKDNFEKVISSRIWESIQKEAKRILDEDDYKYMSYSRLLHLQSIADGIVPFGYSVR